MNDPVIQVRGVSKDYKLFAAPQYRLLDMLGLLREGSKFFTRHAALEGLDFQVWRGEKVAIIGRNGAGKSTLLKLITGVTEPTQGTIEVKGETQALLEMGSGFHPDFTGRENVNSYLAYLGITGNDALKTVSEIVEFAELAEFIDQPVKTYSTGMSARLMFSAATAVSPNILVIDEVLGVGDAYFAQKSFERIEELCAHDGTTVLLVTHDIYSAAKLCDRMIWIDRGKLVLDGLPEAVLLAYEHSIRDQAEQRLRHKRVQQIQSPDDPANLFYCEVRGAGGEKFEKNLFVSRICFASSKEALAVFDADLPNDQTAFEVVQDPEESNWAMGKAPGGGMALDLKAFGSIYHKGVMLIRNPHLKSALDADDLQVELRCSCEDTRNIEVGLYHSVSGKAFVAEVVPEDAGLWMDLKARFSIDPTGFGQTTVQKPQGDSNFGNQDVSITNVVFLTQDDEEKHHFPYRSTLKFRLEYVINDPEFNAYTTALLAFRTRQGVLATRLWSSDLRLSFDEGRTGSVEIETSPLLLGPGEYEVSAALYRDGSWDRNTVMPFFAENPDVIDLHSRRYGFEIESSKDSLENQFIYSQPARWAHNGRNFAARPAGANNPSNNDAGIREKFR